VEILKQKALEASDREAARELRQHEEKNGLVTALDQAVEELRAEHDAARDAMANTTLEVKSDVVSMAEQMERIAQELKSSSGGDHQAVMSALETLSASLQEFLKQESQLQTEEMKASVEQMMVRNRTSIEQSFSELSSRNQAELEQKIGDISRETQTSLEKRLDHMAAETQNGFRSALSESLSETGSGLSARIDSLSDGISEQLTESGREIRSELSERIHEESVKNYRNVQAMVGDEIAKLKNAELNDSSVEKIQRSFRGLKIVSVISVCGIIAIVLYILCFHLLHL
jgi:hypothetical protein